MKNKCLSLFTCNPHYFSITKKTLITAYFKNSNTKYILICINMNKGNRVGRM